MCGVWSHFLPLHCSSHEGYLRLGSMFDGSNKGQGQGSPLWLENWSCLVPHHTFVLTTALWNRDPWAEEVDHRMSWALVSSSQSPIRLRGEKRGPDLEHSFTGLSVHWSIIVRDQLLSCVLDQSWLSWMFHGPQPLRSQTGNNHRHRLHQAQRWCWAPREHCNSKRLVRLDQTFC